MFQDCTENGLDKENKPDPSEQTDVSGTGVHSEVVEYSESKLAIQQKLVEFFHVDEVLSLMKTPQVEAYQILFIWAFLIYM